MSLFQNYLETGSSLFFLMDRILFELNPDGLDWT